MLEDYVIFIFFIYISILQFLLIKIMVNQLILGGIKNLNYNYLLKNSLILIII